MLGKKLLINSTEIYNFIILALQSESIFFNNLFALLRHKKQINFTGILNEINLFRDSNGRSRYKAIQEIKIRN